MKIADIKTSLENGNYIEFLMNCKQLWLVDKDSGYSMRVTEKQFYKLEEYFGERLYHDKTNQGIAFFKLNGGTNNGKDAL